ncbi:PREDICTED: DNA damage-inducible transcript 3 protein, partial [Eurypyga helias]|uniref:DNA damage-inducible transcript 3 protein n=1 Tax=Eurypyga helias TaxID=54383 RepID=UPI00052875BC
ELAKCRERANEQRVLELTAHNEQLRREIQRLSTEVERTRTALIDRIVNLRRV